LAEQVVGILFPTKDGLRDGASRLDKGEAFNTDAAGSELIITVLNWGLGFVAVIAVSMMIYGGFTYLTAGITEKQDDGRKMIMNSIIGLIIILVSFAAVNIVIKGILAIG
jgi:hypothetical protein